MTEERTLEVLRDFDLVPEPNEIRLALTPTDPPLEFVTRALALGVDGDRLLDQPSDGGGALPVTHGGVTNMLFRSFRRQPFESLTGTFGLSTGDTGIHHWQVNGAQRRSQFINSLAHLDGLSC